MKKVKVYFWLKIAGLLSALVVFLIGTPGCRNRRHATKYGPPPSSFDYDQTITKYGVPIDYDTAYINQIDYDTAYYDQTVTKYGVPVDFDIEEIPDTTNLK
jgi:hypothetical protein